jgi:hypothetical protein
MSKFTFEKVNMKSINSLNQTFCEVTLMVDVQVLKPAQVLLRLSYINPNFACFAAIIKQFLQLRPTRTICIYDMRKKKPVT